MVAGADIGVRLTAYARCAGCAAKLGPADLARALGSLPSRSDARLLSGRETFDDAAVFAISEDVALVQTVDFFTPIVDDPYVFGQVAAANALSDVYAMGGEPLTALNIVGFPIGALPLEVLTAILRGGRDKVHEAGALVVGGHTIIDEEVKFGLSVTGRVRPERILSNAAARVGDRLVLTKALGTGILATALKRDQLGRGSRRRVSVPIDEHVERRGVARRGRGRRAMRDGRHWLRIARPRPSHCGSKRRDDSCRSDAHPVLPGVREAYAGGIRTGGGERNAVHIEGRVDWGNASEFDRTILLDPQTSGGLLVALREERVAEYCARVPGAVQVGDVVDAGAFRLVIA